MHPAFLEELLKINKRMVETHHIDDLLTYTMSVVVDLVNAQRGYVVLQDSPGGAYHVRMTHDTLGEATPHPEISTSILEKALAEHKPLLINDALATPDFQAAESVNAYQLRSVMVVPLISREQLLGAIYVENRAQANIFQQEDLDMLNFFANQTASALNNAMLVARVHQSREKIVMAREEERRRLHRDLHDGLGPTLATLALQIETIRNYVQTDPDHADTLLDGLKGQVQATLMDIRRIVYDLRPPALDELGLLFVLREHITSYFNSPELQVALDLPEQLPPLSAAAEVAVYRCITEALTNVIKHAQATHCTVRMDTAPQHITVEIADNGIGFSSEIVRGVGLTSIEERLGELGGQLHIGRGAAGGARLVMHLPYQPQPARE